MSQESEQAQEAWIESAKKFSSSGLGSISYIAGMCNYKAALKAEIEKKIYRLNQMGFNSGLNEVEQAELKALKEFLSLLDTVKPIK